MAITILISDAPGDDPHSEMDVDSVNEAWIHLYALALQSVPEHALAVMPDADRVSNWSLRTADRDLSGVPAQYRDAVAEAVRRLNADHIKAFVAHALDGAYDELKRCGADPHFVESVSSAARQWALGRCEAAALS
jgi:hypothetical protein